MCRGGRGGGSELSRFCVLWRVIHADDFNIKPLHFLERAVNKLGDILGTFYLASGAPTQEAYPMSTCDVPEVCA